MGDEGLKEFLTLWGPPEFVSFMAASEKFGTKWCSQPAIHKNLLTALMLVVTGKSSIAFVFSGSTWIPAAETMCLESLERFGRIYFSSC